MEDVWRGEVQDLLSRISQLQDENKRLLQTPPVKEPPIHEEESEKQEGGLSELLSDSLNTQGFTEIILIVPVVVIYVLFNDTHRNAGEGTADYEETQRFSG